MTEIILDTVLKLAIMHKKLLTFSRSYDMLIMLGRL